MSVPNIAQESSSIRDVCTGHRIGRSREIPGEQAAAARMREREEEGGRKEVADRRFSVQDSPGRTLSRCQCRARSSGCHVMPCQYRTWHSGDIGS
eukprot:678232-Rhodomonas_salina.1